MPTSRLTEKAVAAAAARDGQRLELFDQIEPGLILRVSPEGRKTWVVRYRTLDGRQPRMTLGTYPGLPLVEARKRASAVRSAARDGEDPAADKKRAKDRAQAQVLRTLQDLADRYFAACRSGEYRPRKRAKRASTIDGELGLYDRHLKRRVGSERIEAVTRATLKAELRRIVDGGAPIQANRCRSLLRQMFNFAITEDRITTNPVSGFAALVEETPRTRVLTDGELTSLWKAFKGETELTIVKDGAPQRVLVGVPVRLALQAALLTLQRRGEIASIRRDDLRLDSELPTWTIPGERTKNTLPHLVPLAPLAAETLREALRLSVVNDDPDAPSPFVFPSPRDRSKPITAGALTHALVDIYAALHIPDATLHDLRRTGGSLMPSERLGLPISTVSLVLNHKGGEGGAAVTQRHYAHHDRTPEKRRALEAWERLLSAITNGGPHSNVVSMLRQERAS